ncbi:MAG: metalloenzyme [Bacteroidetes bacterium]|nr:metalloenzyme [Bacteroidota bacterium]
MHSTILIFLDGVGIGEKDPMVNPFFKNKFKTFYEIFGETPHLGNQRIESKEAFIFPTDACMGVDGLPQSGTGQTSIFAGFNAPKFIGKHFGPYPYSTLVPELEKKNIWKEFLDRGMNPTFLNAYPKVFFDYINSGRKRLSVTSLSCLLTGVRLYTPTDLRNGKGLSAEIDNSRWVERLNYNLPIIKSETAARRLLRISDKHELTVFEFFYTDHFGHGRHPDIFDYTLNVLDNFLYTVIKNIGNRTLIICSDHGNLEDISVKSHTRNPSLTITAGKHSELLSNKIKSLYDIKHSILDLYQGS